MSRKSIISWGTTDEQRLESTIKKFNKKIYNLRHRNPELKDILPDTITKDIKKEMIEKFKTSSRSEFNKNLNSLERFLNKGSEREIISKTGNRVTKWEKNEVALKVAQINRERTKQRKEYENLEATTRGEKTGLKRGEMGSERLNELKPKKFNFDKIRGGKEWEKFKESIERQSNPDTRQSIYEQYKENYLKGLDSFGGYADNIKEIIEQLPAELVVKTFYQEQEASIEFYYEAIDGLQDKDIVLEMLEGVWSRTLEEYDSNR